MLPVRFSSSQSHGILNNDPCLVLNDEGTLRQREDCWGWMMDRSYAGWRYAGQLFGPSSSYLPDDDKPMDWLYKVRAVIGVAILVTVGIHYHQATQSIIADFNPVLGGITEPMILELLSVVPATVAVVLFTKRGKREEAFRQMFYYPLKVAVICLMAYGCIIGPVGLYYSCRFTMSVRPPCFP